MTDAAPPHAGGPGAGRRGFTLLELMAVMVIIGFLLYLLPPRMDTYGDRSRLESAANTLISAFTAVRETAAARFFFIDAGEHCVKLSADAETASGIVVGLLGDD